MMKYVKVGNWKPVLGDYLIFKDNLQLWFLEKLEIKSPLVPAFRKI